MSQFLFLSFLRQYNEHHWNPLLLTKTIEKKIISLSILYLIYLFNFYHWMILLEWGIINHLSDFFFPLPYLVIFIGKASHRNLWQRLHSVCANLRLWMAAVQIRAWTVPDKLTSYQEELMDCVIWCHSIKQLFNINLLLACRLLWKATNWQLFMSLSENTNRLRGQC